MLAAERMDEMNEIKTVKLKNGSTEALSLVSVMSACISKMLEEAPIVLYELVEICRNKNHKCFGNTAEELKELGLLQSDGTVHSSIQNIVLSSASGTGIGMSFINPIESEAKNEMDRR